MKRCSNKTMCPASDFTGSAKTCNTHLEKRRERQDKRKRKGLGDLIRANTERVEKLEGKVAYLETHASFLSFQQPGSAARAEGLLPADAQVPADYSVHLTDGSGTGWVFARGSGGSGPAVQVDMPCPGDAEHKRADVAADTLAAQVQRLVQRSQQQQREQQLLHAQLLRQRRRLCRLEAREGFRRACRCDACSLVAQDRACGCVQRFFRAVRRGRREEARVAQDEAARCIQRLFLRLQAARMERIFREAEAAAHDEEPAESKAAVSEAESEDEEGGGGDATGFCAACGEVADAAGEPLRCARCKSQAAHGRAGHKRTCAPAPAAAAAAAASAVLPPPANASAAIAEESDEEGEDCPVCLDRFPAGDIQSTRSWMFCCGKQVCHGCAAKYVVKGPRTLEGRQTCPMCRGLLPTTNEESVAAARPHAERGRAWAQSYLGLCHAKGQGVKQDLKKAAELYSQAAAQGYTAAQCNLALCYATGGGVKQDLLRAESLMSEAAAQGDSDVIEQLRRLCGELAEERGVGVGDEAKEPRVGDPQSACAGCGRRASGKTELRKCDRCKAVRYCGKECQRRHWRTEGTDASASPVGS